MKSKNNGKNKFAKGFTLIELLVVVLIIGILAAIALPQYQMAVGKTKFSTLKTITKSLQQSAQRYYLVNNVYPNIYSVLDIELDIKTERTLDFGLEITTADNIICTIWTNTTPDYISCKRLILGNDIAYYVNRTTGLPLYCMVFGSASDKMANRLCANETGKPVYPESSCSGVCNYLY